MLKTPDLKPAYQTVINDLIKRLKKAKNGGSIRVNNFGTFTKKEGEIKA
jgi:hypothetical protein